MKEHQAKSVSRDLVANGYLDWLCAEIEELSRKKFLSAAPTDYPSLAQARMTAELAAEVRQIVLSSAKDRQNLS